MYRWVTQLPPARVAGARVPWYCIGLGAEDTSGVTPQPSSGAEATTGVTPLRICAEATCTVTPLLAPTDVASGPPRTDSRATLLYGGHGSTILFGGPVPSGGPDPSSGYGGLGSAIALGGHKSTEANGGHVSTIVAG